MKLEAYSCSRASKTHDIPTAAEFLICKQLPGFQHQIMHFTAVAAMNTLICSLFER